MNLLFYNLDVKTNSIEKRFLRKKFGWFTFIYKSVSKLHSFSSSLIAAQHDQLSSVCYMCLLSFCY